MERSKSLPLGYFVAGIFVACFCALALMTAYFYTQGQQGTTRPAQSSLNPRVNFLAAPIQLPEQSVNSIQAPISLAGYNHDDNGMPQSPIDLISAARNISASAGNTTASQILGHKSRNTNEPSTEINAHAASRQHATELIPFRNDKQPTAKAEDIEADRQWLLSLEMNERPDSVKAAPDALLDLAMHSIPATDVQPTITHPKPMAELTKVVNSSAPIGNIDDQSRVEARIPSIAETARPDPAIVPGQLASLSSQTLPEALNLSLPNESPVALSENRLQAETGKTSPEIDSIGDQQPGSKVYSLGDQPASLSPTPAQEVDPTLAIHQESQITGWPLPTSLMRELAEWKSTTLTSHWASAVESTILQLNNIRIDDPDSLSHIQYCEQLADQLIEHARNLPRGQEQLSSQMFRLSMRMKRRFAMWTAVHQLSLTQMDPQTGSHSSTLAQFVNQRRVSFNNSSVPAEWVEYLMLDKAAEVFSSTKATELHRQTTARKIMGRVSSPSLTDEQILYAQQLIGDELGNLLRDAASGEINLGQFLSDLESFEDGSVAMADALINNHFQTFYWSRYQQVQDLAAVFDENYRNANFQIEISDRLINNILPRNMTVNQPVQERILGAQIFGNSRVQNQVSVELIPDPDRLSFRLISNGSVLSRTRAHASGFVFNSLGNAMVNASKGVSIGPEGIQTLPADVDADAQSKLLNVRSRMDSVPLVGWMARHVAEQKQQEQSQKANLIVEQKLRSEFGNRVDQEIQAAVDQGRLWAQQKIVDPFNALELEPMIANMRTTERAALVRYRLAGLDQNASNTMRPQSLPGSLVGVQIHESAINNIINRVEINGRTFTAPEFMQHISAILGRTDVELGDGEYEDVKFQFASRDSVRFDFDEDRIAITLRIKRLQIGRTGHWKNLSVTAWYFPRATGLHIDMVLDPDRAVSLAGQDLSFGDQLTVRTVFNALFKPDFDFPLLPPDLASRPAAQGIGVTQIVLVDGWAGLSVSEFGPTRQSQVRQPQTLRNARILQNRWR